MTKREIYDIAIELSELLSDPNTDRSQVNRLKTSKIMQVTDQQVAKCIKTLMLLYVIRTQQSHCVGYLEIEGDTSKFRLFSAGG